MAQRVCTRASDSANGKLTIGRCTVLQLPFRVGRDVRAGRSRRQPCGVSIRHCRVIAHVSTLSNSRSCIAGPGIARRPVPETESTIPIVDRVHSVLSRRPAGNGDCAFVREIANTYNCEIADPGSPILSGYVNCYDAGALAGRGLSRGRAGRLTADIPDRRNTSSSARRLLSAS
jgi:hypothetical protein